MTAASASGRGPHSFRWTSYPPGRASRRERCRLSTTGSFAGSSARSSGSALSRLSLPQPLRPRRRCHVARRDGPAAGSTPIKLQFADRFVDGVEVFKDGTELHLASFCLADAELRLAGTDDPALAALKVKTLTCWVGPHRRPGLPPEPHSGLDFERGPAAGPTSPAPCPGLPPIHGGVPGASGPLGPCALVYMDDCLVHSPTLEQHLLYVAEVLEIFRRRQLYAKSSKCEFGRQELGFLGHRQSAAGVSVDPRKVQSIVEWATPTSCAEARPFAGLANYYRRFVEGYAEPDGALHEDRCRARRASTR